MNKKQLSMETLRPNQQRAKNAILLIYIVLAMNIVVFISSYMQYSMLEKASGGHFPSFEEAKANDQRELLVAVIYMIIYIVSAITFIQWFRRAYFNLHQRVKNLSSSEGWAAGCWFVPVLNLFKPYQIMSEMFKETAKYLADKTKESTLNLSNGIVGLWWTIWVVNAVTGYYVYIQTRELKSIETMMDITMLSMISALLLAVLAPITIKIIKNYSAAEEVLAEETGSNDTSTYNSLIG
jgi:uncharacterized membrane protein